RQRHRIPQLLPTWRACPPQSIALNWVLRPKVPDAVDEELLARPRGAVLAGLEVQYERGVRARVASCRLLEPVDKRARVSPEPLAQRIADLVQTLAVRIFLTQQPAQCQSAAVALQVVIAAQVVQASFQLVVLLRVGQLVEGGMGPAPGHGLRVVSVASSA